MLLSQMIISTSIAMFSAAISMYYGNGVLLSLAVYSFTGSFVLVSLAAVRAYATNE